MQVFCNLYFIVCGWLYLVNPAALYGCCLCFSLNSVYGHCMQTQYSILSTPEALLWDFWNVVGYHLIRYSEYGLNTRQTPILVTFIIR